MHQQMRVLNGRSEMKSSLERFLLLVFCALINGIALSQTPEYGPACQKHLRLTSAGTYIQPEANLEIQVCPVGSAIINKNLDCSFPYMAITSSEAISRYASGSWRLITPDEARRALPYVGNCLPLETWTSAPAIGFTNRSGSTLFLQYGVASNAEDANKRAGVRLVRSISSSGGAAAVQDVIPSKSTQQNSIQDQLSQSQKPQAGKQGQQTSQSNTSSNAPSQPQQLAAAEQSQLASRLRADAQVSALQNQKRADADAQRRGRRIHDPAAEAHDCIAPNFGGLYGGMVNNCSYVVHYTYCAFRPKSDSWLSHMDCEKQQFGSWQVGANREAAAHTKGAESIHWFACRDPAWSLDHSFEGGEIRGRCRDVGRN